MDSVLRKLTNNLKLCEKRGLATSGPVSHNLISVGDEMRCQQKLVFSLDSLAHAFLGQYVNICLVIEGKLKFKFFSLKDSEDSAEKFGLIVSLN